MGALGASAPAGPGAAAGSGPVREVAASCAWRSKSGQIVAKKNGGQIVVKRGRLRAREGGGGLLRLADERGGQIAVKNGGQTRRLIMVKRGGQTNSAVK